MKIRYYDIEPLGSGWVVVEFNLGKKRNSVSPVLTRKQANIMCGELRNAAYYFANDNGMGSEYLKAEKELGQSNG